MGIAPITHCLQSNVATKEHVPPYFSDWFKKLRVEKYTLRVETCAGLSPRLLAWPSLLFHIIEHYEAHMKYFYMTAFNKGVAVLLS